VFFAARVDALPEWIGGPVNSGISLAGGLLAAIPPR
jgi:hypothetical protein